MRGRFQLYRRAPGLALFVALLVGMAAVHPASPAAAQAAPVVPTQWIAKQFTEILGRAPSPTEWNAWVTYFQANGCTADTLRTRSRELLVGTEMAGLYPASTAKAARVIAAVRAVYNHEPNSSDWSATYVPLAAGSKTWDQVVDGLYNVVWAAWVVPEACSTTKPGYGFGSSAVLDVKNLAGQGASRTAATLQSQLDAAAATCGTVPLAPNEVVRVNGAFINVPPCVRLTTSSSPAVRSYARQARIVGEGAACLGYLCVDAPVVNLGAGAELHNVWVDARNALDGRKTSGVQLSGSSPDDPGVVDNVRVTDPGMGGTGIRTIGFSVTGTACAASRVTNNLVTGYARSHALDRAGRAQWADGITVTCEDTLVSGNDIVDVGDWGIGVHGSWNRTGGVSTQRSVVRDNRILSAGVPGTVAVGLDAAGLCQPDRGGLPVPCIDSAQERPFIGTTVERNTFWTGPRTSFDVGLMVGGKTFWGDHGSYGRGAVVRDNTTGAASARVNVGIAVSGMYDVTLSGNTGSGGNPGVFTLVDSIGDTSGDLAGCPRVAVADYRPWVAGLTPGSQPSTTTALYGCLLLPFPTGGLERVVTSTAGNGTFVGQSTGLTVTPWGHNYGPAEGLLDDNWTNEATFAQIVADLREHKLFGATVLRIHPQLNKFMTGPTTVNAAAFDRLARLALVAEKLGLYLDITGLGAWRKADNNIPDTNPAPDADDWLSSPDEELRWHAQEVWWEETARRLKDRTSIIWFNLMNENVAIDTPAYCNSTYGGYCFVQSIVLQLNGRSQTTLMRTWIDRMRRAIERGDGRARTHPDHRVTASNMLFPNKAVTGDLDDFMIIHSYIGEDPATPVSEFANEISRIKETKVAGKPLVIEEFFYTLDGDGEPPNLQCGQDCLERAITESKPETNGWIGHADGHTLAQGVPNVLAAAWLLLFQRNTPILAPCGACEPS
jgi:hypothetical protein